MGGQKACVDAEKDTLINSTGFAGCSLSEKGKQRREKAQTHLMELDWNWRDRCEHNNVIYVRHICIHCVYISVFMHVHIHTL